MSESFRLGRRRLLGLAGAGLAGLTIPHLPGSTTGARSSTSTTTTTRFSSYPFSLGVASGDPLPDSVVLWTRVAPDPVALDGLGGLPHERQPITVRWEVATADTFAPRTVVQRGVTMADPNLAGGDGTRSTSRSVVCRQTARVVVTAEPMTDVDTSAADVLQRLHGALAAEGIELAFAEMKSPVTDQLERYGLLELLGPDSFFPTIGTAVKDYVDETGVEWVDWEDAALAAELPSE